MAEIPRLSILLPVYNEEAYIRQCLDSLVADPFPGFEVVINDNCSTDETWAIVEQYAARDTRINAIRNDEPLTPLENFFSTYRRSRGSLIYMVGGDDYIIPGFLTDAVSRFEHEPDLFYLMPRLCCFDDCDGKPFSEHPLPHIAQRLNDPIDAFVRFYLDHCNHDEIIMAMIRREYFDLMLADYGLTLEPAPWWMITTVCIRAKQRGHRMDVMDRVCLWKRYHHRRRLFPVAGGETILRRSVGSLRATLRITRVMCWRLPEIRAFMLILFKRRRRAQDYMFCPLFYLIMYYPYQLVKRMCLLLRIRSFTRIYAVLERR